MSLRYLFALALVVGCNARMYLPSAAGMDRQRLAVLLPQTTLRKNNCYPAEVSLLTATGSSAVAPIPILVSISNQPTGVFYSSLQGCQYEDDDTELSDFFIAAGTSSVTAYFRAKNTGSAEISFAAANSDVSSARQAVEVSFARFNPAAAVNESAGALANSSNSDSIYIAGNFYSWNETKVSSVIKLSPDGTLDQNFNGTGSGADTYITAMAVQPDERVVVVGYFDNYNGIRRNNVARLNSDGTLDSTLAPVGAGLNSTVYCMALQPDGKILVGGAFSDYSGVLQRFVARLNSDGSLDSGFNPVGTGLDSGVNAIAVQPDGKILVGGGFTFYNGTSRGRIARLNADGSLDTSFAPTGSGFNNSVETIQLQSDGRIVVGGYFTNFAGTGRNRVARLNSNGSLDSSFAPSGTGLDGAVSSMSIQPDGKLLLGGYFRTYNGLNYPRLLRVNSNGTLDTSFVVTGSGLDKEVRNVLLRSDGTTVVQGNFSGYDEIARPGLAKLGADGSLDPDFANLGSGFNGRVNAVDSRNADYIVVGGNFSSFNGIPRLSVARLHNDGMLDLSFEDTGTGFNDEVMSVAVQADDRVLVGGNFTSYNGAPQNYLLRLLANGHLDTGFTISGSGLDGPVTRVAPQPDGRILVSGYFFSYNGISQPGIVRLQSNGALDPTFNPVGSGLNNYVQSFAVQSDGRIVIVGDFANYNGTTLRGVGRLNVDGSLDSSFAVTGTGINGSGTAVALQSDGKILVAGYISSYNGIARNRILRLNSNGTLDTTFATTGTGVDSEIYTMALQPDGRIVLGGIMSDYNSVIRNRILRLRADGTLDPTFIDAEGVGFNEYVSDLGLRSDGKIIAGGFFTGYSDRSAPFLVRLTSRGELD